MLPEVRVDIVIPDEFVDGVVSAIAKGANSGSIDDDKVWVSLVDSALGVPAGERDNSENMTRQF